MFVIKSLMLQQQTLLVSDNTNLWENITHATPPTSLCLCLKQCIHTEAFYLRACSKFFLDKKQRNTPLVVVANIPHHNKADIHRDIQVSLYYCHST